MPDEVLEAAEVTRRIGTLPGWEVREGRLHRDLVFDGFRDAFAFMTSVALAAERLDHHPDWSNSWNRVVIDITNHASGGLTARSVALAAAVDAAAAAAVD